MRSSEDLKAFISAAALLGGPEFANCFFASRIAGIISESRNIMCCPPGILLGLLLRHRQPVITHQLLRLREVLHSFDDNLKELQVIESKRQDFGAHINSYSITDMC
jgi:hypothetical protein